MSRIIYLARQRKNCSAGFRGDSEIIFYPAMLIGKAFVLCGGAAILFLAQCKTAGAVAALGVAIYASVRRELHLSFHRLPHTNKVFEEGCHSLINHP